MTYEKKKEEGGLTGKISKSQKRKMENKSLLWGGKGRFVLRFGKGTWRRTQG